jgi:hypothetical protein
MKEIKEKNFEICGAKTKKDGSPCQKPAGWGTDHQGVGKCKLHVGASPIKHGMYSKYTSHRLGEMVDKLADDEELLDLRKTIALQQSIILSILEKLEQGKLEFNQSLAKTLNTLADKLGRNIERRQKVEEGEKYILEVTEVKNIVNQVVTIVNEEIRDDSTVKRIAGRLKGVKY